MAKQWRGQETGKRMLCPYRGSQCRTSVDRTGTHENWHSCRIKLARLHRLLEGIASTGELHTKTPGPSEGAALRHSSDSRKSNDTYAADTPCPVHLASKVHNPFLNVYTVAWWGCSLESAVVFSSFTLTTLHGLSSPTSKTDCASGCASNYLRHQPFSFKSLSFLLGNMMRPAGFHDIIQQGSNWDKPAIFLAQPFHEPLKLRVYLAIIKACSKMGVHNTCAVFFL